MEKQKTSSLNYLINLCFFLYFVVLFVERIISSIISLINDNHVFSDFYHGFTYILVFLSLVITVVALVTTNRNHFKALFTRDEDTHNNIHYRGLCYVSGILLVSGMIHLDSNISIMQFVAYGILIIGLLLKTIINNKTSKDRFTLWLSFIYLVCFAMAIPVMYPFSGAHTGVVYALEVIAMLILVAYFAFLESKMFVANGGDNLFFALPYALLLIFDVTIIVIRWQGILDANVTQMVQDANVFVLIFLIASSLCVLIYFFYRCIRKINNNE